MLDVRLTKEQMLELKESGSVAILLGTIFNENGKLYYINDFAIYGIQGVVPLKDDGCVIINTNEFIVLHGKEGLEKAIKELNQIAEEKNAAETNKVIFHDDKLSEEDIKKLNEKHKTKIINAQSNIYFSKQQIRCSIFMMFYYIVILCFILIFCHPKQFAELFAIIVLSIMIGIYLMLLIYNCLEIKKMKKYIGYLENE